MPFPCFRRQRYLSGNGKSVTNVTHGENFSKIRHTLNEKGAPGPWITNPRTGSAYVPVLPTDAAVLKTSLSVFRYGMPVTLDPVPVSAASYTSWSRGSPFLRQYMRR